MKACRNCRVTFRNHATAIGTPMLKEQTHCPFCGSKLKDKE